LWFAAAAFTGLQQRGVDIQRVPEPELSAELRNSVMNDGVTGFVQLDPVTGDRLGGYEVFNMQLQSDGTYAQVSVGDVMAYNDFKFDQSNKPAIVWPTGSAITMVAEAAVTETVYTELSAKTRAAIQVFAVLRVQGELTCLHRPHDPAQALGGAGLVAAVALLFWSAPSRYCSTTTPRLRFTQRLFLRFAVSGTRCTPPCP
jgi:hypothetical protein